MEKEELQRRYLIFIISLFFSGLGIAFTRRGGLGVSPISSVANVIALRFDFISFGMWLFLWNLTMLLLQIIILRRDFNKIQLLQIPLSLLFGVFTDIGALIANRFPVDAYSFKLMAVFIGITILAFGISLAFTANVVMNSGEGIVKAISDKSGFDVGSVKIAFDISCVVLSIVLSILMFDMKIVGTREGTVLSAFFVGVFVKFFINSIREDVERYIKTGNLRSQY